MPPDLAEQVAGTRPKRPTIQVSNPLDIRQQANAATQRLAGGGVPGFSTDNVVKPYQAAEAAAQGAVYNNQDQGGGGTTVQAPSVDAFTEDQLRRQHPLEVDGYQFLKQFEVLTSMLGAK